MAATGVPMRPLSVGEVSDNLDVARGPGQRILYQRAGNQNYFELDPDTASERFLAQDGSPGWMFAPVYSPQADRIAVMWNRPPTRGIWIIDSGHRSERLLYASTARSVRAIGWSRDGAWIYVVEGKIGLFRGATSFIGETTTDVKILRIPSNGGAAEMIASLPGDEIGVVTMTPDGRRFIYPVFSSRSDVWVVDDFDNQLSASR